MRLRSDPHGSVSLCVMAKDDRKRFRFVLFTKSFEGRVQGCGSGTQKGGICCLDSCTASGFAQLCSATGRTIESSPPGRWMPGRECATCATTEACERLYSRSTTRAQSPPRRGPQRARSRDHQAGPPGRSAGFSQAPEVPEPEETTTIAHHPSASVGGGHRGSGGPCVRGVTHASWPSPMSAHPGAGRETAASGLAHVATGSRA